MAAFGGVCLHPPGARCGFEDTADGPHDRPGRPRAAHRARPHGRRVPAHAHGEVAALQGGRPGPERHDGRAAHDRLQGPARRRRLRDVHPRGLPCQAGARTALR
eukprot:4563926-Lingulodinium_polyedra.AAC.1